MRRGAVHAGLRGAQAAQPWAQLARTFHLDWHHRDVLFALTGERCALPVKLDRRFFGEGQRQKNRAGMQLKKVHTQCRKEALKYCENADQHHQNLEEICEPAVANKFFDSPEANRSNDADDQNIYQD